MSDKSWCADMSPSGEGRCTNPPGHIEDHFDATLKVSWTNTRGVPAPLDTTIPDTVRTRVELHRAQTAHDLMVLRAQLDTITVSTLQSRRLRARREQLTAELDAWSYLARVAKNPR